MPRRARRVGAALAVLLGAACGGGGGDGGGTTNPPPTQTLGSITASPTTMNLAGGETAKITPSAKDTQGATIAGVQGFTYTSDAPTVADVSGSGNVVGLSTGQATITVSLTRDGVTKQATVAVTVAGNLPTTASVSAGASNAFSPPQVAVAEGGVVTFTIGGTTHNVTFDARAGAPANIGNSTNVSVDRTFNTAGDFDFTCTLHSGMDGKVVVR
jgi:plastocyanin